MFKVAVSFSEVLNVSKMKLESNCKFLVSYFSFVECLNYQMRILTKYFIGIHIICMEELKVSARFSTIKSIRFNLTQLDSIEWQHRMIYR